MKKTAVFISNVIILLLLLFLCGGGTASSPPADTQPQVTQSADTQPPETQPISELLPILPPETQPLESLPILPPESLPLESPPITPPEPLTSAFLPIPESPDMGQEYLDGIIFLTDSTMLDLWHYGLLSGGRETTQIWTGKSGYLLLDQASRRLIYYPDTQTELTIAEAAASKQPETVIITLGVNGVSYMSENYFKSEYKKIINTIRDASPDTTIILQSVYPVLAGYDKLENVDNERIDRANGWIMDIAAELELGYLETNSILKDENGCLRAGYDSGDGMHLGASALRLVLEYIRTHGYVYG